ncbi:MAG: hypothetical protein ABJC09_14945 [Terriglobia bacterium]
MSAGSLSTEWLEKLWWREAWLTLRAAEPATLPAWLGSTIRGALGHLWRSSLCALTQAGNEDDSLSGANCGHECLLPARCPYYSLFENKLEGARSFILIPPPPPGLEEIALGGPVVQPYRTSAPGRDESVPSLRCEAEMTFDPGATLRFGLRLFGPASESLPAVVDALARFGLCLGGYHFQLAAARDGAGQLLYDSRFPRIPVQNVAVTRLGVQAEAPRAIRVVFLSPAILKLEAAPTFSPADFAARFFDHTVGTAARMHQSCFSERLPWVELPDLHSRLVGQKLYRYKLRRHSRRQDKWLDFDGLVGYMDLRGEFGPAMPFARAAEAFHFGQKSALGQGAIRVLTLE